MAPDNKGQFDQTSGQVQELLGKYDKAFSGELIEIAVGQSELKEMFENHPEYQQEEYEGMPSMKIAQKLEIITADAADALLMLQAGASMVRNSQKIAEVKSGHEVEVRKIDKYSKDFKDGEKFDSRFKALAFGGSPEVVDAQASYAMSEVVLTDYVRGIKSPDVTEQNDHLYRGAEEAFAKYGSELMSKAAAQLRKEPALKSDVAEQVEALAKAVMPEKADRKPVDFAIAERNYADDEGMEMFKAIGDDKIARPILMDFVIENTLAAQTEQYGITEYGKGVKSHPKPKR